MTVTLYTAPGCPACLAAKLALRRKGIEFEEVDVVTTPGAQEKLLELTGGQAVVPVIDDNGTIHVGFDGGR